MNQYITGTVIKELRERKHMTQADLAEKLCVSDKTISKWETAKGYPEGNAESRFQIRGIKKIFYYCNRDGLFLSIKKREKPSGFSLLSRKAAYSQLFNNILQKITCIILKRMVNYICKDI